MGLATLVSEDSVDSHSSSDAEGRALTPRMSMRSPDIVTAKETRHANRLHSYSYSPAGLEGKASPSAAGPAVRASYRETKQYLLSAGLHTREITDAPTTFHLRNYATEMGIDLGPLESKLAAAKEKAESARATSAEAASWAKNSIRARWKACLLPRLH